MMGIGRRESLLGAAAFVLGIRAAAAQSFQSILGERLKLTQGRAVALGLARVGAAAPPVSSDASAVRFNLSQLVQDGLQRSQTGGGDVEAFVDDAGKLLSDVNSLVRDPDVSAELAGPAPSFDSLKREYAARFKATSVDPAHGAELTTAAQRIVAREAQRRYRAVQEATGVPWFVVGALHYREASLNFMGHLHNGDFLKARTVQVPRGQPRPPDVWPIDPWNAEKAWQISAESALRRLSAATETWTVERMLYGFEGYNGWGYRAHENDAKGKPLFLTPYLWNYTQFYKGGGFPCDHCWSTTYHSRQAGLVAIIKRLAAVAPNDVRLTYET